MPKPKIFKPDQDALIEQKKKFILELKDKISALLREIKTYEGTKNDLKVYVERETAAEQGRLEREIKETEELKAKAHDMVRRYNERFSQLDNAATRFEDYKKTELAKIDNANKNILSEKESIREIREGLDRDRADLRTREQSADKKLEEVKVIQQKNVEDLKMLDVKIEELSGEIAEAHDILKQAQDAQEKNKADREKNAKEAEHNAIAAAALADTEGKVNARLASATEKEEANIEKEKKLKDIHLDNEVQRRKNQNLSDSLKRRENEISSREALLADRENALKTTI